MSEPFVLTNTPRPGDTQEQVAARTAPREPALPRAARFYLTEPSRNRFVVNVRLPAMDICFEISRDQLANFLIDGTSIALRSENAR